MLDSLFMDFLFKFFIWLYGCFSFSDMDFWVVDGCFLGGWWLFFLGSWWQFFEALEVVDGGFNGCVLNG